MPLSTEFVVSSLQNLYGNNVTSADVRAWCNMNGTTYQTVSKKLEQYKSGRGKWNLTVQEKLEQDYQAPPALPAFEQNLIPQKDDTFVKFGNFADIKKIIKSNLFYPALITGLSGNGKTFLVEQFCATPEGTDSCPTSPLRLMKMISLEVFALTRNCLAQWTCH